MKILIADDEPLARERLARLLAQLPGCRILQPYACNGQQALELVHELEPDILLLDIYMPALNGLQVAKKLSTLPNPPAIIFCTAHDEYALEAFQVNAIGYLVKPVRLEQLAQALRQAQRLTSNQLEAINFEQQHDGKRSHINIRTHRGLELVPVDSIDYFMADQKYITIFHSQGQTLFDESLKNLEQEFSPQFIRIHRSLLVNINKIERLQRIEPTKHQLWLRGHSQPLPVSRRHLAGLRSAMAQL